MRRRLVRSGVALVLVAAVAACGDDDDVADLPATSPGQIDAGASADTADGADTGATDPGDTDDGGVPLPASGGECNVEVTGAVTSAWTAGGSSGSVLASYWYGDAERELLGDDFAFILNCEGDTGYVGFVNGQGASEETVPFGPGTYELQPSSEVDPMTTVLSVLVTLEESETVWGLSAPGTLDITAWDDSHIAGTFELPMTDTLSSISGEESEGDLLITGSFDYTKP